MTLEIPVAVCTTLISGLYLVAIPGEIKTITVFVLFVTFSLHSSMLNPHSFFKIFPTNKLTKLVKKSWKIFLLFLAEFENGVNYTLPLLPFHFLKTICNQTKRKYCCKVIVKIFRRSAIFLVDCRSHKMGFYCEETICQQCIANCMAVDSCVNTFVYQPICKYAYIRYK